ncbi:MAG: hypothetical protein QOJ76_1519 [Acidobacteriota bacterium]|jgi:hypothetical protein|nr:hypothetical protein [Acidobacteriota bacterium]
MTDEERLDRLERITKLMVKAGLRARGQMREQSEKIDILIDSQIKNEERFAALADAQFHTDRQLAKTNERLNAIIGVVEWIVGKGGDVKS